MNIRNTSIDTVTAISVLRSDLHGLLKVGYPGDQHAPVRDQIADQYIANELNNLRGPHINNSKSGDTVIPIDTLTDGQLEELMVRCRYYGASELVNFLSHRKLPYDPLSREEAVSYIQDRLYANDFNRIRYFDESKSVSFATYISRVINNLIIDYQRKKGVETKYAAISESILSHTEGYTGDSLDDASASPSLICNDTLNEAETEIDTQFMQWIAEALLSESQNEEKPIPTLSVRREELRRALQISSRERIFLRALCYDDLNINQIRVQPFFEMSINEAYQFYHQLMKKVVDALRETGLASEIHALVTDKVEQLDVYYDNQLIKTYITEILYLAEADKGSSRCHASPEGRLQEGQVKQPLKKLGKKYYRHFIPISSDVLIADRHVENVQKQKNRSSSYLIKLRGLNTLYEVGTRYVKFLPQIWINDKKNS